MQFIHPLFLIAMSAMAIPILIHLFNFRKYKRVYFTNVRLLQEIQQETKKQSRLRQWLILLARLLAIASLVIAFAQPYIPASKQQKKITDQQNVSIYVDNSFSMEAVSTEGKLLDVGKNKALEIMSAYAPSDLFQLLTNDFEGKHQRFVSPEELRRMIDEVQVSPNTKSIPEIINRQNDMLPAGGMVNYDAYIISDFQVTTAQILAAKPDTNINWFLTPLTAEKRNNLFIDSVYFLSPVHQPGQPVMLRVRIQNASGESLEKIPVKLTINSVQKALASIDMQPNATTDITLSYTENSSGIQYGLVEIVDYPIVHDDKFYFAYPVLPVIPVMAINEKEDNKYLNALFHNDSLVRFTNSAVKQLDYNKLFLNSLVVLNSPGEISSGLAQEINRYVRSGGNLVVFPPLDGKVDSYNTLLALFNLNGYASLDTARQRMATINVESELYNEVFEKNSSGRVVLPENIDLPMVFKYFSYKQENRSQAEVLCKLQNNQPFLITTPIDKGQVYIFCTPLDDTWSIFPRHMIFVPTMYKIALLSNPMPPLSYVAGESATVEIPADSLIETNVYKIKKRDSDFEVIPAVKKIGTKISLVTYDQIREAGFYEVSAGINPIAGITFNYNRKESDLTCLTWAQLEEHIQRLPVRNIRIIKEKKSSIAREIHQIKQGTPLWKLFIILALLFLAMEILLIRLLKQR